MRTQHITHVGTLSLTSGDWDLYDYYPTARRDFKITSAVPKGKPTCSIAFTCEASFERWLEHNSAPVQQNLFGSQ
jgi:hypothetical protein